MQNFQGLDTIDTIDTMQYAVFSGGGYYLYYTLRIIFWGWILFILCNTQYLRGVNNIYTINYVVFWGVDTILTMHYAVFSRVDTIYTMQYPVFSRGG